MADHLLPTLDSPYTLFLSELSTRVDDAVKQSRSDTVALTNPPVGTIRWNTLSAKWESNTGTVDIPAWTALTNTYGINVATANSWTTGRTIALTGDVTGTSGEWKGSGNISFSVALASVNANVGAFGGAAAVPMITVNAKGLVTAVSTAALGSMATQAANSVAVTGGAISATAITLVGAPDPVPTVEGLMEWGTEDSKLRIGDGAGTKVFTPDDLEATLLNKEMGEGCTWGGAAVLVANGGTGATTAGDARTNLGLGNVNDTSDANKPVSDAQQVSLNLKADLASPVFTGTPAAPTATAGTDTTQVATTAHVFAERANTATLTNKTLTGLKETKVTLAANNIDLALGNFFSKTISGATTLTVSNVPTTGTAASFILDLTNGGRATITWWSGVKWANGSAPTLTADGRDVLGFFSYDAGATWTGLVLAKDVK